MEPDFYEELIASMLDHHPPTEDQAESMAELSYDMKRLARKFDILAPNGPAKTIALRKLHEFRMAANYAIVGGK